VARQEEWSGGSGSSGGGEWNNELKLNWGKKREAIGVIIGEAVGAGVSAAKGFVCGRESSKCSFGDGVRFGFSRRGTELKDFSNAPRASDESGRGKECLRESEPKLEGITRKGNTGV
jgi:hypothetical protein